MTRDLVDQLNLVADQIVSEGMTVRASVVRAGAAEIKRQRLVIEEYEKERIAKLGGIGSPA